MYPTALSLLQPKEALRRDAQHLDEVGVPAERADCRAAAEGFASAPWLATTRGGSEEVRQRPADNRDLDQ